MKAVVAIVTFGVTPEGGAVGQAASCGAPICSTLAFTVEAICIAANVPSRIAIKIVVITFLFASCIFFSSMFCSRISQLFWRCLIRQTNSFHIVNILYWKVATDDKNGPSDYLELSKTDFLHLRR